jgi:sarcosine oxidase subunit alpha
MERVISVKSYDVAVIGGGPAGLKAALVAARAGAKVAIVDDADRLGGQLVKQTHMFFFFLLQHAGTRGIDIARMLADEVTAHPQVTLYMETMALGIYDDKVLTIEQGGAYGKIKAEKYIVATGASEKMLAFPGNDLPGVYGAGAVQTLMNVHGVKPGDRVLMIGAGNIGLIVSYQLLQAGVEVVGIVEGSSHIGGYLVHASKIRRMGVPILTSHTIVKALGEEKVTGALITQIDDRWQPIPGTEQALDVDVICLAVGLSPLADLLWQAGVRMCYIPELGGHVPWRDDDLCTSLPHIYIAGDVAGVEEASSAMVEGELAGWCAVKGLGLVGTEAESSIAVARKQLETLRSGPVGDKIRAGLCQF